jgi:RimJ/RimL family protein N-acetyltransferase
MKLAREERKQMYFSRFPPSNTSLSNYLVRGPLNDSSQILFLILDEFKTLYGHVGLKFNSLGKIEIDNVLKISKNTPGLMRIALQKVIAWGNYTLGIAEFHLQVISSNTKAISLYSNLGFYEKERISLKVESLGNEIINLVPCDSKLSNTFEEMLLMKKVFVD